MPKYHESYGAVCQGPFNFPMLEKQARELDKLLESDNDLEYFRIVKNKGNQDYFIEGERADVSTITDDSVDRDGEAMCLKTIDFSPLEETRLVAFNHNYEIPPIAKNIWLKKVNNRWIAKSSYPTRPDNFPVNKEFFPDTIFHLIKEGLLPGKSIGGVAKKRQITPEDITANPSLAKAKVLREHAKVYEYSVVTLNCNKNAIVEAVSKGIIQSGAELLNEFPELKEIQNNIQESLIKDYMTVEQYKDGVLSSIMMELGNLKQDMPKMMDKIIARMLGKV